MDGLPRSPPVPLAGLQMDQLLAFDRVVREGSFSRAALALRIGQPAVSTRIRLLEAALGGPLFRRGRRIAITTLGESFLPYVHRALEVLAQGAEVARLAQVGQRGRVTLGTLGSLAGPLVGPALARFSGDHPDVECVVRAGDHEPMLELLLDGIVELALLTWPCASALEPELRALLRLREPVVLVAHPRHELARRPAVTADDIVTLGRPFHRLRWWQTHHPEILRLAERAGRAIELPKDSARCLVRRGVGVGFFTRASIADDLGRGDLVEIRVRGIPPLFRDSALVRRMRVPQLSPAAAALVASIKSEAQRMKLLHRRA